MDAQTMDSRGINNLIYAMYLQAAKDYVLGRTELIRAFGRVPDKEEFISSRYSKPGKRETYSPMLEYYRCKEFFENDPYFMLNKVSAEGIFRRLDKMTLDDFKEKNK